MNHSGGLSPGSGAGFFREGDLPSLEQVLTGIRAEGGEIPSPEQILSGEKDGPAGIRVEYEPGTAYRYSNGGYRLIQLVVEESQPAAFDACVTNRVLLPLGMTRSTFEDPVELEGNWRPATPYDWRGNPIPMERFVGIAATGLYSCVDDMIRLMKSELNHSDEDGPLSRESVRLMHEPQPHSPNYGLGHVVQNLDGIRIVGHSGLGMGWNATLRIAPERDAGIVVLTNSDNGVYVHQTIVATWLFLEFGLDGPGQWTGARKRAGRLTAYGEWIAETSTVASDDVDPLLEALEKLGRAIAARDAAVAENAIDSVLRTIEELQERGRIPTNRAVELKDHANAVRAWILTL